MHSLPGQLPNRPKDERSMLQEMFRSHRISVDETVDGSSGFNDVNAACHPKKIESDVPERERRKRWHDKGLAAFDRRGRVTVSG